MTRQLATQVDATGDSVDPSSYRRDFDSMAIQARTLKADASTILSVTTDETMGLENISKIREVLSSKCDWVLPSWSAI